MNRPLIAFLLAVTLAICLPVHSSDREPAPIASMIQLPELPTELSGASGKVDLIVAVTPNGKVASVDVLYTTDDRLKDPARDAISTWEFTPASRDEKAVIGLYRHTFRFENGQNLFDEKLWRLLSAKPQPAAPVVEEEPAVEVAKAEPEPQEPAAAPATESAPLPEPEPEPAVAVETVPEPAPEPTAAPSEPEAPSEELVAAVEEPEEDPLAWLRRSEPEPIEEAVEEVSEETVEETAANMFKVDVIKASTPEESGATASVPPQALSRVQPALPPELAKIRGNVNLRVDLDATGKVVRAFASNYSHEELVNPCLKALEDWQFTPYISGGKPHAAKIIVPFQFVGKRYTEDDLKEIAPVDSKEIASKPAPLRRPLPTTPKNLADETGEAEASFIVDEFGYVSLVEISKATHPDFGESLKAALYQWKFMPALGKGNQPVASIAQQSFRFEPGHVYSQTDALDVFPQIASTQRPKLSKSLRNEEGFVLMFLRIDRRGNVADARVMESSNSKLDKPCIDAASRYKFKPGYRNGKAVESTMVIPMTYPLEAAAEAPSNNRRRRGV